MESPDWGSSPEPELSFSEDDSKLVHQTHLPPNVISSAPVKATTQLVTNIEYILMDYPYGVSLTKFYNHVHQAMDGGPTNLPGFGSNALFDILSSRPDKFWVLTIAETFVLFPKAIEAQYSTAEKLVEGVWDKIKEEILQENGLQESNKTEDNPTPVTEILSSRNRDYSCSKLSSPYPWFQIQCEKIPQLSDEINAEDILLCVGAFIQHPAMFYVRPKECGEDLKKMMNQMKFQYNDLEVKSLIGVPWVGYLRPGFYVAIRKTPKDKNWYRAKIVEKLDDFMYSVHLIDYGDLINVRIQDMHYLLKKFMTLMKTQSIQCVAKLGGFYRNKFRWTSKETNLFKKRIAGQNLAIQFKEKRTTRNGFGWNVVIHLLDENCRRITQLHVEREVLRISRGLYHLGKKEQTETRIELAESDFKQF